MKGSSSSKQIVPPADDAGDLVADVQARTWERANNAVVLLTPDGPVAVDSNEEVVVRQNDGARFLVSVPEPEAEPEPPPVIQQPRVSHRRTRPRSHRSRSVPAASSRADPTPSSGPSAPSAPPPPPPTCRRCFRLVVNGDVRRRLCGPCSLFLHHREGGAR